MKIGCVFDVRLSRCPKLRHVPRAVADLGHAVRVIESVDELREADAECDLLLFDQKGATVGPNAIRDAAVGKRAIWVQIWRDLIWREPERPLERQAIFETHRVAMEAMDIVCLKEPGVAFKSMGINAVYLDQGLPYDVGVCEHHDEPECDVVLWGSRHKPYTQRRRDVQALVSAGFRVAWAGTGCPVPTGCTELPWCPPDHLPRLMSRAAVTLCVDYRHDVPGYWSDRLWFALGAGAMVVRRETPCLPEWLTTYGTHEGLIEQVGSAVQMPAEMRGRYGYAHRAKVLRWHTLNNRLKEVFRHVANMQTASV